MISSCWEVPVSLVYILAESPVRPPKISEDDVSAFPRYMFPLELILPSTFNCPVNVSVVFSRKVP